MSQPHANQLYSLTTGTFSTDSLITVLSSIDPSISDVNFPIGKRWVNTQTAKEFILIGFVSFNYKRNNSKPCTN